MMPASCLRLNRQSHRSDIADPDYGAYRTVQYTRTLRHIRIAVRKYTRRMPEASS